MPDAWTPDQFKNFHDYWDLYFSGDQARRRAAEILGETLRTIRWPMR